jgi:hypothetical protein
MGRRSRKRIAAGEPAGGATRAERDAARQRRAEAVRSGAPRRSAYGRRGSSEPPPAPWGSFPLSEFVVLLALVLGVVGAITWGDRGKLMLVTAMALGSLAGLEVSIREHFAGYRSHTTLLAVSAAVIVMFVTAFAAGPGGIPYPLVVGLGVFVFVAAFWALQGVFRRRSGGLGFR